MSAQITAQVTAQATAQTQVAAQVTVQVPPRRGVCPSLSQPLPTGDGLLVRLMPIGAIPLDRFAGLCAAARRHGNGLIEITARGNIQVRGLSPGSAPRFASDVAALDIVAEEGVPILCDPLAGLAAEEIFDAMALAAALRAALARQSIAERLDPKVSVIVDGGGPLGVARVPADIRLTAQVVDGAPALRIGVGGDKTKAVDLGCIAPAHAIVAVSRLLAVLARGGRDVRARDIVAAQGASLFRHALASAPVGLPAEVAAAPSRKQAIGLHQLRDGSFACGIATAFGHAEAAALEKLVEACLTAGGRGLRTAPERILLAIGLDEQNTGVFVAAAEQLGFVTRADDPRQQVIACAGAPFCASGLIAARAIAPQIADAAAPYLREGSTIHVSGCGKGCAHSAVAALTVVGTAGDCILIANGSTRDAPFAAAPVGDLPASIARHLREGCGAGKRADHGADHGADHV